MWSQPATIGASAHKTPSNPVTSLTNCLEASHNSLEGGTLSLSVCLLQMAAVMFNMCV